MRNVGETEDWRDVYYANVKQDKAVVVKTITTGKCQQVGGRKKMHC